MLNYVCTMCINKHLFDAKAFIIVNNNPNCV